MSHRLLLTILAFFTVITNLNAQNQEDPYLWLEDINDERAIRYVKELSEKTNSVLKNYKDYQKLYDETYKVLNDKKKIEYPNVYGEFVYNFLKNNEHKRGIWRRTLLTKYLEKKSKWETILDIDKLSKKDGIKWVYKGVSGLYPDYNRFMVYLSDGGGDATIKKEFDVDKKKFIDKGFIVEESKGSVGYLDKDTLIVSTNFGEGTMTESGYPNQVKLWKRGTPITDAKLLFEGEISDVFSTVFMIYDDEKKYVFVKRALTFYTGIYYIKVGNDLKKIDIPNDSVIKDIFKNQLLVELKSDWVINKNTYSVGSLISMDLSKLLKGEKSIQTIIIPTKLESISSITSTKNKLLVTMLNDIIGELYIYSYENSTWKNEKVEIPPMGTVTVVDSTKLSDRYFFAYNSFLIPTTLYVGNAENNTTEVIKSLKGYFNTNKYKVRQKKVRSKDGSLIPYFLVYPKSIEYNGKNPTLLYGYGGFEISIKPFYSDTYGISWLEKGGVLAFANIRGGGEYGPEWHQSGLKEKRQNTYNDFYAIAEDLINSRVTTPKHLGIMGGSNGGLLVGVAFTQRPELFNAVVCQMPLLDMKRYNKLLAGASWMGEYGNPDIPEEWEYIKKYSPYQNVKKNVKYPKVFFYTSSKDDRVHPGHARKMVAKMIDMGHPVYYYENTEGGHTGTSTNEQKAKASAMIFSYLLKKVGG